MPSELDIIGIATPIVDILHTESGVKKATGHNTINTLFLLQDLGLKTGILGRMGQDQNGEFFLKKLKKQKVDTGGLRIDSGQTARVKIKVTPETRKFLSRDFYHPLKELSPEDREYLGSAESVFIRERNPLFSEVAEELKDKETGLFFSLHESIEPKVVNLESIKKSGPETIFSNEEEFEKLEDILDDLLQSGTKIAVTKGEEGCTVYTGGETIDYPAFEVDPVDPTGAGDAFAAGFLFGELKGWPLEKTARLANALGAMLVTKVGAEMEASLKKVKRFLKSKNSNLKV